MTKLIIEFILVKESQTLNYIYYVNFKNKKLLLDSLLSTLAILLMSSLSSLAWVPHEWPGGCTGPGCYDEVTIINNTTNYNIWVENVWGASSQRSNPSPVVLPGKRMSGDPFYYSKITGDGYLMVSKNTNKENPQAKQFKFWGGDTITGWKPFKDDPAINITVEDKGMSRDEQAHNETHKWTLTVTQK